MKNKLLIFFAAVLLSACSTRNADVVETDIQIRGVYLEVYVIDSCEYIGNIVISNGDYMTHKGNCKFCIKRGTK